MRAVIDQAETPERPEDNTAITDELWALWTRCWDRNTSARPTSEDVFVEMSGIVDRLTDLESKNQGAPIATKMRWLEELAKPVGLGSGNSFDSNTIPPTPSQSSRGTMSMASGGSLLKNFPKITSTPAHRLSDETLRYIFRIIALDSNSHLNDALNAIKRVCKRWRRIFEADDQLRPSVGDAGLNLLPSPTSARRSLRVRASKGR